LNAKAIFSSFSFFLAVFENAKIHVRRHALAPISVVIPANLFASVLTQALSQTAPEQKLAPLPLLFRRLEKAGDDRAG